MIGEFATAPMQSDVLLLPGYCKDYHISSSKICKIQCLGVKMEFGLDIAPMEFFLMSSDAAGTYNYIITECALLVNRVQLAPSLSMAHMRMLQEKNAVYSCKYTQTYLYNIPQGRVIIMVLLIKY